LNPDEVRVAIDHYYRLLGDAQKDFNVAAARTAQYVYMWGTLGGLVGLGFACGVFAFGTWLADFSVTDERVATALACAIAGGFGAGASVSWRVTVGDFLMVDPGAGVLTLRRLGALRPFIGAIFGLALYLALKSGFIDIGENNRNFYFFAFLAFLAGFSERAIPELLRTAEQRLGGAPPASR
jgi:hypothetical protein